MAWMKRFGLMPFALLGSTTLAMGLVVAPTSAVAQSTDTPERGETVGERQPTDYDPIGIPFGGFRLFPQVTLEEAYDDNILRTDTGTVDSFITVVTPKARLQSEWSVHSLGFEVESEIGHYWGHTKENYQDYGMRADGRVDIRRDTILSGSAGYSHDHEDRGSPDDDRGSEPTTFDETNLDATFFQGFNRVSVSVDGNLRQLKFDNTPTTTGFIDNQGRNRTETEEKVRVGYEIVPEFEAFVAGGLNQRNYDLPINDGGFNRDSDGYEVSAGVSIALSELLTGDVSVGYMGQSYDDPALKDIEAPKATVGLTWNATRLTTVRTNLSRSIQETTSANSAGFVATNAGVTVDHELRRNIILTGGLTYSNSDYQGITREDNTYGALAEVSWLLNRVLDFGAKYEYSERSSNLAGQDYKDNKFTVGITAKY